MKLIIPDRIASKVEPRLGEIVPGCAVVQVDQDGAADGDLAGAEVLLRWWTSHEALRRIWRRRHACVGCTRPAPASTSCSPRRSCGAICC